MTNFILTPAVLIVMLQALSTGTRCSGITVPLPRQLYILERSKGTVRCQNRSDDGQLFHSYITNAVWYRRFENGTNITVGSTGSVYSMEHTLNFDPLLPEDQGEYFCCTPNGLCSITMTTVIISKPPIIRANDSNYTATVGSEVMLKCNIINNGVPTPEFEWKRNGIHPRGDIIIVDNSFIAIKLSNLSKKDAGKYTCSASNVRSYRSDLVELTIVDANITTGDNNPERSTAVQLLLMLNGPHFLIFKHNLSEILEIFVLSKYDSNVTVVVTESDSKNNPLMIIFELHFVGLSANNTLQELLNDINSLRQGLDIGIGILKVCNQNCTLSTSDNNDQERVSFPLLLLIVIVTIVIVFAAILTIFSILAFYMRHQRKRKHSTIFSYKCDTILKDSSKATDASYDTVPNGHRPVHHKYHPVSITDVDL
ncbi:uncharacterized protein [Dysidea avara]|uniref:uncharacterized protein isoform X2 n=1 Tax=Dysidea avara TaxID=196820 RepID=UPI00332D2EFD